MQSAASATRSAWLLVAALGLGVFVGGFDQTFVVPVLSRILGDSRHRRGRVRTGVLDCQWLPPRLHRGAAAHGAPGRRPRLFPRVRPGARDLHGRIGAGGAFPQPPPPDPGASADGRRRWGARAGRVGDGRPRVAAIAARARARRGLHPGRLVEPGGAVVGNAHRCLDRLAGTVLDEHRPRTARAARGAGSRATPG